MKQHYDVIVVGAGSGGLTAAVGFTKVGKRVLLVEKEHMGGECTNTGCIPSKALLHHAREYHQATEVAGKTTNSETYRSEAFGYVRNIVDSILADETPETFKKLGIDVVLGEAVFSTNRSITVGETSYTFTHAVIATGSSPRMIEITGLDQSAILTNQNLFGLSDVPAKLLVIGGGPIGMEMAQACAMLGSKVTIAERGPEFAGLEDPAIRPIIRESFEKLGIIIKTNAAIQTVAGSTAHFDTMDGDRAIDQFSVDLDKVLIAIGRVPNLPAGLDKASINAGPHGVQVDTQYRTTNKRVYAVGDVAQRLQFTHTADDIARQVVARVASKGLLRVNTQKAVPKVTYISPEVAQVGLSWDAAIAKYSEDRIMRIEVGFDHNDRAKTDGVTTGKLIVIARRLSGKILGAHIVGPGAGEIITVYTLAIDQNISLWKLQKLIVAYPTYSLIIKKAADQFVGRQLSELKRDLGVTFKRHAPKLLAAGIWIGAIITLNQYQTNQGLTTTQTAVNMFAFFTATAWGPVLYILVYAIRPVTFFPATALTILAGITYGFLYGTLLTLIAATLAAAVAYLVGRFFSSSMDLQDTKLGPWILALQQNTFTTILTMRLIFLPFDLVSYAAGILKATFVPFLIATFTGIIFGTATFISIGASIDIEEFQANGVSADLFQLEFIALAGVIFAASLLVSKLLKR